MTNAVLIGTSVGAIIGLLHACYVYLQEVGGFPNGLIKRPVATRARGAYYAVWTFLIWAVFGSSVLLLWMVGGVGLVIYKATRLLRAA